MNDAIGLQNLFLGTMSSAAIVLCGALYALFFALGRLHRNRTLLAAAAVSFVLLTVAVVVLVEALALSGFWLVVTGVMLTGYFLAPRAVWRLCVGTHGEPRGAAQSRSVR